MEKFMAVTVFLFPNFVFLSVNASCPSVSRYLERHPLKEVPDVRDHPFLIRLHYDKFRPNVKDDLMTTQVKFRFHWTDYRLPELFEMSVDPDEQCNCTTAVHGVMWNPSALLAYPYRIFRPTYENTAICRSGRSYVFT